MSTLSPSASASNRCTHCGAPTAGRPGQPCTYCNAVQPAPAPLSQAALVAAVRDAIRADRDGNGIPDVLDAAPPTPAPRPQQGAAIVVAAGAGFAVLIGLVTAVLVVGPSRPIPAPRPVPTPVVSVSPAPLPSPTATEAPAPSATSTATARSTAPAKPVPKLTNEQYGKNIVAAQHKKLLGCVEQDLVRNPNVPKAYTVTVLVERDGAPRNSATTFSPKPTEGFQSCARHVIFYGFNNSGRNPPELVEFTFSTSFAFPNAKPAAKAEHGRGWDD